ncbi:MAG: hypothetical protein OXN89_16080 [Bryobacterales bacterium]|nr:hypothetical protein [Bryobacterales bacterium]
MIVEGFNTRLLNHNHSGPSPKRLANEAADPADDAPVWSGEVGGTAGALHINSQGRGLTGRFRLRNVEGDTASKPIDGYVRAKRLAINRSSFVSLGDRS